MFICVLESIFTNFSGVTSSQFKMTNSNFFLYTQYKVKLNQPLATPYNFVKMTQTIEQFVTDLETNFDQNQVIDFSVTNLKYYLFKPVQDKVTTGESCPVVWGSMENGWDVLLVYPGESKVFEVVIALKKYLPRYKDNLLVMPNKNGYYSLLSTRSIVTTIKFALDHTERYSYISKHPKIISHNRVFVQTEFWSDFRTSTNAYIAKEGNVKLILKFAEFLLINKKLTDSSFELPPPYFYQNVFYQTHDDLLKAFPDEKGVEKEKFELYKGIMVLTATLTESQLKSKVKTFKVESDTFSIAQLLEKYTLTETQLTKFFVQQDGKQDDTVFVCLHPDVLKAFEK